MQVVCGGFGNLAGWFLALEIACASILKPDLLNRKDCGYFFMESLHAEQNVREVQGGHTWIVDSGSPVMEASDSFILMSGYCVAEKALSSSLSCALLKVVRFRRLWVSKRVLWVA